MRIIFFALVGIAGTPFASAGTRTADVIVYGSTPGGFCAAIASAREGASVILVEPTGHIGGVNTGGLSFSDSNQTIRSTVMGLFDEWHRRVEADYRSRGVVLPYEVAVKDNSTWTYEPHVAMRVTLAMLKEAGVEVMTGHPFREITKEGPRITAMRAGEDRIEGRIFVDATYEGDLMAAAGVSWTIGREGRAEYNESMAGKAYPKKRMEISGFDGAGNPLPLITATDAGPEEGGDRNVMVYSFRLCLTKDPANRVPFPEPADYDPGRFEVIRRYYQSEKRPQLLWDLYPLPGGKFDANNGIGKQFSMGLVGAANGWSEGDESVRAKKWEEHRQYTLELYRFLTTDPSVPEVLRDQLAGLGLCRDEFAEHGHWSPQLYVREGRRMISDYVVSQRDILETPEKEDAVVISSFPIDSHDCQRIALPGGGVVNEGTIFPVRMPGRQHGYPYHVPYRSIVPKAGECDNLLVPVALSCTHVAISSIRVEPTWMILGQSAGIAAALAARKHVPVQALPYPLLRERLLAAGQVLALPVLADLPPPPKGQVSIDPTGLPGLVLDDATAELSGSWSLSSNFKPHLGTGYRHDEKNGDGSSVARFRFKVKKGGTYDFRVTYSAHETRATNVPYVIESGAKRTVFTVDQTIPLPPGELFRSVGTVDLSGENEAIVTVSNKDTDGFVILDGIQLLERVE